MIIVQLTITLEGIKPVVTRVVEVPADIRLDRLHLIIQAAIGWENSHLYEFVSGAKRWGVPDLQFDTDALPVAKASLAELINAAASVPIRYVYDFGDDWVHRLEALTVGEPTLGHLYPRLINITGRCPPEDVGGLPGYEHFLSVIGDPDHPEHDDLTDWAGGPYDPHIPESDELRLEVLKLAKKWKPKKT